MFRHASPFSTVAVFHSSKLSSSYVATYADRSRCDVMLTLATELHINLLFLHMNCGNANVIEKSMIVLLDCGFGCLTRKMHPGTNAIVE